MRGVEMAKEVDFIGLMVDAIADGPVITFERASEEDMEEAGCSVGQTPEAPNDSNDRAFLILREPGNMSRRVEDVRTIVIPDMRFLLSRLSGCDRRSATKVWRLCHDLVGAMKGDPRYEITEADMEVYAQTK